MDNAANELKTRIKHEFEITEGTETVLCIVTDDARIAAAATLAGHLAEESITSLLIYWPMALTGLLSKRHVLPEPLRSLLLASDGTAFLHNSTHPHATVASLLASDQGARLVDIKVDDRTARDIAEDHPNLQVNLRDTSSYRIAGRAIIGESLQLTAQDQLSILTDVQFMHTAAIILDAALELNVPAIVVTIPDSIASRITAPDHIPDPLREAIQASSAVIIVCDRERVPLRTSLLEFSRSGGHRRVGTMPSVGPSLLPNAITADYDQIVSLADSLFPLLVLGSEVNIRTYDADARPHDLRFGLDGMRDVPYRSTGIIERGKSGNIPSGECFANPAPGTINGAYVCDGSFPGLVVERKTDELVLHFEGGRLHRVDCRNAMVRRRLLERLCSEPDQLPLRFKMNCDLSAEFGLGVNPAIRSLVGVPINDEKMYGTVHIAIGKNKHFGWGQDAAQHVDMITLRPEVSIDGVRILADGQYVSGISRAADKLIARKLRKWSPYTTKKIEMCPPERNVYRYSVDGSLIRILRDAEGREEELIVARPPNVTIYRRVLDSLSTAPKSLESLERSLGVSRVKLRKALGYLHILKIVAVQSRGTDRGEGIHRVDR